MQKDFQPGQGIYENGLDEVGRPAGSPYQIACGEMDIHQGGLFGDGEDGKSGDERVKGVTK